MSASSLYAALDDEQVSALAATISNGTVRLRTTMPPGTLLGNLGWMVREMFTRHHGVHVNAREQWGAYRDLADLRGDLHAEMASRGCA